MDFLGIGLWALAVGAAVLTVAGFLSRHWWLFDVASHLRTQYALGSAGIALLAVLAGEISAGAVALMTCLVNTILVLPQLPGRSRGLVRRGAPMRILFANVLEKNQELDRLAAVIEEADADVVILAEVDADAMALVRLRLPQYPYFEQPAVGSRPLGIGLLSKSIPTSSRLLGLGESGSPLVIACFDEIPSAVTIIGAHPLPPHHPSWFRQRNAYMRKLADLVAETQGEVIVVGDFNVTPWSWHYGEFLRRSRLRDSRSHFGLQTTWPTPLPPLMRIAIDHCFVSAGVAVLSRCVLRATGSDHLPIVVDVGFDSNARTRGRAPDGRPSD
jgi:endonuclease/exonuclease/phosphatase (EEP) superfamily protein YafD